MNYNRRIAMDYNKINSRLIGIHNVITNIYVHGDDAIRMAGVLTELRAMISELNEQTNEKTEQADP